LRIWIGNFRGFADLLEIWRFLLARGSLTLMVDASADVRCFENGAQFARLVVEGVELGTDSNVAFDEDFQPVFGLVRFLDRTAQFGDELSSTSGTATRVIIG